MRARLSANLPFLPWSPGVDDPNPPDSPLHSHASLRSSIRKGIPGPAGRFLPPFAPDWGRTPFAISANVLHLTFIAAGVGTDPIAKLSCVICITLGTRRRGTDPLFVRDSIAHGT